MGLTYFTERSPLRAMIKQGARSVCVLKVYHLGLGFA